MIVGLGIDLVETERITRSLERFGARFEQRVFSEAERAYCRSHASSPFSFAARFAAKEAFFKALGTGLRQGVSWTEVSVERGPGGRPVVQVSGRSRELMEALGAARVHVSITHTPTTAAAVVILER